MMAKKKRGKTGSRKNTTSKKARGTTARRGRPTALSRYSFDELAGELARRQESLMAEREELVGRLAEIDEALGSERPASPRVSKQVSEKARKAPGRRASGRKRPKNDMTLEEAMASVLDGKTMGVSDLAEAVLASGYKTGAANFRTMVNQTLIRSDRFRKVSRGKYTTR